MRKHLREFCNNYFKLALKMFLKACSPRPYAVAFSRIMYSMYTKFANVDVLCIIITRNATVLKLADPATRNTAQHSFSHDLGTDMWYVCLR